MHAPLDRRNLVGLTEADAAERLKTYGHNELPSARPRTLLAIALEVVKEPMFLLLLACGAIYLLVGDLEEALILLSFVFLIMGITFFQERKTERALEALRDLSSPRALVIREGRERRIAGRDVVPGDLVVLAEGDRVPADGLLLSALSLGIDESLLTGESVPVRKVATDDEETAMGRPGGDDLPSVYSGSLVVSGQGVARVRSTGLQTEIGQIGRSLKSVEAEATPLQREVGRLVKRFALIGLAFCLIVGLTYGVTRSDWLHGILAGLTLAMAMVPEEFPVVLTIFLALGAWRISRRQVLTRRVPAVETLGSAAVLCVDKTGTLTQNHMSIRQFCVNGQFHDLSKGDCQPLPELYHEVAEFGILASQRDPHDPMEVAFKEVGDCHLAGTEHLHANWSLVHEYPLSRQLLALSHVWRSPDGQDYVIAVKGAPEAVGDLCHLTPEATNAMTRDVAGMAEQGLRVLGVAKATFREGALPDAPHDFDFAFVGLAGLADPVRPAVPAAVAECHKAGIRVVMITGDYPATARAIAKQIGLWPLENVTTGPELDEMPDSELQERVRHCSIFARVVPEQKLRLVNAFKANGEVTAMTGDGVNDAPALKSAHIGIAMGGRGTDVAREAAALVLLDDDFSSIVAAVRLGRRIFDNLRKAMAYILAVHVPIAGMSLLPVLFKWPLALLPVHVVFLEMIIDPACTVVFEAEAEEADVMERAPRNPATPMFGARLIALSLLQGVSVLLITLAVFVVAMRLGRGEGAARALSFTTLIVANLSLILTNRSWSRAILATLRSPNRALWWVVGFAACFLTLSLTIPWVRGLFRFDPVRLADLGIALGAGVISIGWFEAMKVWNRRQRRSPGGGEQEPSRLNQAG